MAAATEIDLGGHPALAQRPRGAKAAYLFAHGAGAGMRHAFMATIADALAARGIAVVRWELPYMAAGKARPDSPAAAERAVHEAYSAFAARHRGLALFAGGKSFGGRMTSRAHANAAAVEAAAKATARDNEAAATATARDIATAAKATARDNEAAAKATARDIATAATATARDIATAAKATARDIAAAAKATARDIAAAAKATPAKAAGRAASSLEPTGPLPGLRGLVFFGFPLHPPEAPATTRADHLRDARGDLLFLQGDRDELADLALLGPTLAAIGPRATLHVVAHADHGFDVLVRSGRRPAEVIAELADTASSWMLARV